MATILPKIGDVIENLGAGPYLVKEVTLGASIWLAAGSQLIIVSCVTLAVAQEWNLEGWQRGATVSVIFLGIMLGNFASGPFSDTIGRRLPILISLSAVVIFSIASAFASAFWILCSVRFILGAAFGLAQPAWITLCTEISPSSWRMVTHVASDTFFVMGEIYAASLVWLDDPMMKNLHWRSLTIYGTAPAAIMTVFCYLFLNESASWLALQGQIEKAKSILQSVQWWNGKENVSVDFSPPLKVNDSECNAFKEQMSAAMGKTLGFTTVVLCFTCFVMNFVYYGTFYAFPLILGDVDIGVSPAVALIIGAMWEFAGYLLAIPIGSMLTRRVATLAYLALVIVSTISFVEGARLQRNKTGGDIAEFALQAGAAGIKCFINIGFIIIYQYCSEVYPTNARVAGSGLTLGCGRVGSMIAPMAFELMMAVTNDRWEFFFYSVVALCSLNAILILFLPFDTHGMTLKDYVEDMGEKAPLVSCECTGRPKEV